MKSTIHVIQNMVNDMNLHKNICPRSLLICEACIKDKQHRAMFPMMGKDEQLNLWR
jgi:hypothetical protein